MEKEERRILALDTASHKTGYAIYIDGKITESDTWTLKSTNHLSDLHKRISGAITKHRITMILAEDIFKSDDPRKISAYKALSECRGVVMLVAQDKDIPFKTLTPLEAKQIMWGYKRGQEIPREEQKARMIRRIEKLGYILNEDRNGKKDDDQADAIGLLISYLRKYRLPIEHPDGSKEGLRI